MYRCQLCHGKVPANNSRRAIVSKRPKEYPFRKAVNRPIPYIDQNGRKKVRVPDDPGGQGWEIESEIQVCEVCFKKHEEREKAKVILTV